MPPALDEKALSQALTAACQSGKNGAPHYPPLSDISNHIVGGVPPLVDPLLAKGLPTSTLTTPRTSGDFTDAVPAFSSPLPSRPAGVPDIDAADRGRHLRSPHLAGFVHSAHFSRECLMMAEAGYMERQPDLTGGMRAILVDWLVDVHAKFNLRADTLHLTINVLDRFLEETPVARNRLQLAGLAALFVAGKIEEVRSPPLSVLVAVADHTYTKAEVIATEAALLNAVRFELVTPYATTFLRRNMKALKAGGAAGCGPVAHLAGYMLELALQSYEMLGFCPSELAAAATLVAGRLVWGSIEWGPLMLFYSGGWDLAALRESEMALVGLLRAEQDATAKLNAVKRKYASSKFGNVSTIAASVDLSIYTAAADEGHMECGE